ncbi:ammonium transporter [Leptolyngbya sp. FACHB-321]|uniref:ammonium transporter n=1 Tax=Leptolyngbya sp. FACHB-321 TaxID=2692807 RepID=UPI00168927A2|nr:ammonium transporter [Leptolyngbya sp. FACHB-321]MBD2036734.1 ammonium transporter [Leptolyngbya sp. FACHB-321]
MYKLLPKSRSRQRRRRLPFNLKTLRLHREWLSPEWYSKRLSPSWQACIPLALLIVVGWSVAASAQAPTPPTVESVAESVGGLKVGLDTMWVMVAAMLVFFMNAGFCMLETGFCRQKNAVNVLAKNLIVFAFSSIAFWVVGWGLMFGNGNPFFGTEGLLFLSGADNSPLTGDAYQGAYKSIAWAGVPLLAKFFFQLVFAGTAATIVSGAVAERIKFIDFLIFSVLLVGIAYPITGHMVWGGGLLATSGFWDFAGSTVVHSVGGWAALMGAALLGPRIGKYNSDGSSNAFPGHNLSIATLGCLILWLGWFGFNPGSTMSVNPLIAHIAMTTNLGAAFGGAAATITAWIVLGKPDLSMVINGILAGLVAVTASCAFIPVWAAAVIGAIGGVIVVYAVLLLDKLKIDDPVGAIPVHLVNGLWGTLAVGLFATGPGVTKFGTELYAEGFGPKAGLFLGGGIAQLWTQFIGAALVGLITVVLSTLFWVALKSTLGIRVSPEEEVLGLDIGEHGMEAYAGFIKDPTDVHAGEPAAVQSTRGVAGSPY